VGWGGEIKLNEEVARDPARRGGGGGGGSSQRGDVAQTDSGMLN